MLLDETLACLELMVEERLALSSLITVEARVIVVVSVSDVVKEELSPPPLSPPPPQLIKINNDSRRTKNEKDSF